jgi:hypothetical protein
MARLGSIYRFRNSVLENGVARPSKYEVIITPPENLKNMVTNNSTLNIIEKNIGMACNSIVMPGRDLTAISVKQGQDLAIEQVGAHTYEGTITATFYLDPNLDYKSFFEAWQNLAVNPITNNLNYYDNYIGSMSIHQLGAEQMLHDRANPFDGDNYTGENEYFREGPRNSYISERVNTREIYQTQATPVYGIKVEEVYPATVGQIEYAYATVDEVALLPVEFQYRRWQTIAYPGIE